MTDKALCAKYDPTPDLLYQQTVRLREALAAKDVDYAEQLRLLNKYSVQQGETVGQILARVDRSRREDLSKMLEAWQFWGDLGPEFQSELLDCIEHTYNHS